MSFGFLKNLLSRDRGAASPDLAGPLRLAPGDRVLYYQRAFLMTGIVALTGGDRRFWQYRLRDEGGDEAVLIVADGAERALSLQSILPPGAGPEDGSEEIVHNGVRFRRVADGAATTFATGDVSPEKTGTVRWAEYRDEDDIRVLFHETWPDSVEVRAGESLYENELELRRAGEEERFDVRPPPRLDRRSILEARRVGIEVAAAAAKPEEEGDQPSMS
jgi:hypothetical protein